jgi:indole-3-glycerol phosphate synthase
MPTPSILPSILQRILQRKSEQVAMGKTTIATRELAASAKDCPPPRGFEHMLRQTLLSGPAVIAEVKKASPSAGVIRERFEPDQIARSYATAGAACLSVLTDEDFFQGHADDLKRARRACSLPVLRKDFIIDPWQIYESRVMGADCILLIVAALDQSTLQDLLEQATACGLDVLVEVHDETQMERVLLLDHDLIGVNNRDLNTFETSLDTSQRLHSMLTGNQMMVTESGIRTRDDVTRMQTSGINVFLVGEAFMRKDDPGDALSRMFF